MPRILVVAPNWIGDALMAQPLLARLKQSGATLDVLAPAWVAPVVRRMPEVDEVIEAPLRHGALQLGERWRLGRELKRARLRPRDRAAEHLEVRAGSLSCRHSAARRLRRRNALRLAEFDSQETRTPRCRCTTPASRANPGALPRPRLHVSSPEIKETKRRFGIAERYIVLCPGAEYGPAKRWPYFKELARGSASRS